MLSGSDIGTGGKAAVVAGAWSRADAVDGAAGEGATGGGRLSMRNCVWIATSTYGSSVGKDIGK
jgi:hypothetical protein